MATKEKKKKKEYKRPPRPGEGAPSKYDPKYCDMLIEHMGKGLSFRTFAAVTDIHVTTLYEWCNPESDQFHREFSYAKKIGDTKSQLFWEKMGIGGAAGKLKNFNAATWIYNMKCRFSQDWLKKSVEEDDDKTATIKIAYERN